MFVNPLLLFGQVGQFDPHALCPKDQDTVLDPYTSIYLSKSADTHFSRHEEGMPDSPLHITQCLNEPQRNDQMSPAPVWFTLTVSVSCCYIVTLIWSWDRKTTRTAVGWEHDTMTVRITSSNHSVLIMGWIDVPTVGVDSSWQWFSSESAYLCVTCICVRNSGWRQQVCSRLSVLIFACSVHQFT